MPRRLWELDLTAWNSPVTAQSRGSQPALEPATVEVELLAETQALGGHLDDGATVLKPLNESGVPILDAGVHLNDRPAHVAEVASQLRQHLLTPDAPPRRRCVFERLVIGLEFQRSRGG